MRLTAITWPDTLEDNSVMFVAQCPELDVVSQGETRAEAINNLKEAVELMLEVTDDAEVGRRLKYGDQGGAQVAMLEVAA
jgi:predicted RNase H-like HicB family nuclease